MKDILYLYQFCQPSLQFRQHDLDELKRLVTEMHTIHALDEWGKPHHRFHSLLVAYTGQQLHATITDFAAHSELYVRIYGRIDAKALQLVQAKSAVSDVAAKASGRQKHKR